MSFAPAAKDEPKEEFCIFMARFHRIGEDSRLCLERDLQFSWVVKENIDRAPRVMVRLVNRRARRVSPPAVDA